MIDFNDIGPRTVFSVGLSLCAAIFSANLFTQHVQSGMEISIQLPSADYTQKKEIFRKHMMGIKEGMIAEDVIRVVRTANPAKWETVAEGRLISLRQRIETRLDVKNNALRVSLSGKKNFTDVELMNVFIKAYVKQANELSRKQERSQDVLLSQRIRKLEDQIEVLTEQIEHLKGRSVRAGYRMRHVYSQKLERLTKKREELLELYTLEHPEVEANQRLIDDAKKSLSQYPSRLVLEELQAQLRSARQEYDQAFEQSQKTLPDPAIEVISLAKHVSRVRARAFIIGIGVFCLALIVGYGIGLVVGI